MTTQKDIMNDERYIPILDYGFVGLVDVMPREKGKGDAAIVQAARVSYGKGTKTVSDDRNLIRYLMRHNHTSPFEMVEFKFHIKIPIFVKNQLIRHRTANVNEYSGRYSIMSEEFYLPELEVISYQSKTNKQGRENFPVDEKDGKIVRNLLEKSYSFTLETYRTLLGKNDNVKLFNDRKLNEEGISRELARICLPLANYTELYFKIDLKNLLHLLKLRTAPNAQYEIRVMANAMLQLIRDYVPMTIEAWEDYQINSITLSRNEMGILSEIISENLDKIENQIEKNEFLSKGEKREFREKIEKLISSKNV